MLRQHVSAVAEDLVHEISLQTYKSKFEYETIYCAHCKFAMTDYYDLDAWPYGIGDFKSAYEEVAKGICEIHGFDRDDPHIVLSGNIAERQSSLHICPMCAWWVAIDSAVLPALKCQFWLVNLVAPATLTELDTAIYRRHCVKRGTSCGDAMMREVALLRDCWSCSLLVFSRTRDTMRRLRPIQTTVESMSCCATGMGRARAFK